MILILPLTEESRGLIGSRQFGLMRQGALLVNAARGPVVQTDALVEALNAGKIRAALLTSPTLSRFRTATPCGVVRTCCSLRMWEVRAPQFAPRSIKTAEDELRRYMAGEPLRNVVQAAV